MLFLRAFLVWLVIIAGESVSGILRSLYLAPSIGDLAARRAGFFIGLAIIFAITWAFIRWTGATRPRDLWMIGVMWMVLTAAFEFGLAYLLGLSRDRVLEDYDPSRGGLMAFGLVFLVIVPWLAGRTRGLRPHSES
jgi:hypothetical protein